MPRYTIDTDDESYFVAGDEEVSFGSVEEARAEAHRVLAAMAVDVMPDGNHRVFSARVHDAEGQEVYVARLTLEGTWKGSEGERG